MAQFLFVYHGGAKPSDDVEVAAVMAKWKAWMEGAKDAFVNMGAPVGMSKTVSSADITDDGGANPVSGYSIVEAANIDGACIIAKGCPIHESGGTIEVAEIMQM